MNAIDIRLLSICVGQPRSVPIVADPEPTAFVKRAADGPVMARAEGLAGDALGTPRKLGVANHAVYVLPAETLEYWRDRLSRPTLEFGELGENIVIDCPDEETVAIGDRIKIGAAELTVIQPRIPCYKLAHFLGMPQSFPHGFLKSGRTGFYCAVTRPGLIERGDAGHWVPADEPRVSSSRFIELTQFSTDRQAISGLLDNPYVINGWKDTIRRRLEKLEAVSRRPEGDGWLDVRCQRIDDEGEGIKSFHLADASGVLNDARGGQFLTVRRMAGAKMVIRNYSISMPAGTQAAEAGCVRISVKLERAPSGHVGAMSGALHADFKVGENLSVRPPAGHFTLPESADRGDILLASGGIGITPMLGMLWQAVAEGRRENFRLVHAHRATGAFPFAGELKTLTRRLANLRVEAFNTGASGASVEGLSLRSGRPDWSASLAPLSRDGLVYACGPGAMIEAVVEAAAARGLGDSAVITESFGTGSVAMDGARARISFARSGRTVQWTPSEGSLLDLAISSGIDVSYSCRSGICGSCEAPVLAGGFAYPQGFTAQTTGNGHILLCSAVPKGDLIIDI